MALFSKIPIDKARIEDAIGKLEKRTSAEIRVFVEGKMPKTVKTAFERACNVFRMLEMDQTQNRNAVLVYLAFKDHQCYILGDQGIHQFVGERFWQSVCDEMVSFFKRKKFTPGILYAVERIGDELVRHFPVRQDDVNELPDEVIIND